MAERTIYAEIGDVTGESSSQQMQAGGLGQGILPLRGKAVGNPILEYEASISFYMRRILFLVTGVHLEYVTSVSFYMRRIPFLVTGVCLGYVASVSFYMRRIPFLVTRVQQGSVASISFYMRRIFLLFTGVQKTRWKVWHGLQHLFTHRFTLQRRIGRDDGRGGVIYTWKNIGNFKGRISPTSMRGQINERMIASQEGVYITHVIYCDIGVDIQRGDKILWRDIEINVENVREPDYQGKYLIVEGTLIQREQEQ